MRTHSLRASWIATAVSTALVLGAPVVTATNDDQGRVQNLQRAVRGAWSSGEPFVEPRPFARLPRLVDRADGEGSDGRTDRGSGPTPHILVRIHRATTARTRPAAGAAVVGTVPAGSKYYGVPTTAWVEETTKDGRWGRVEIPYVWPRRDGWIHLRGLARDRTNVQVHVDLSRHWVNVTKFGRVLFGLRAATGAPASPTPPGRYFVTDRIPFPAGGSLGSFAFGISGIQPNLPAGWNGGNQLAIHGTDAPSSIGASASAGCLRVSERGLDRLMPLLRLGTPVVVQR